MEIEEIMVGNVSKEEIIYKVKPKITAEEAEEAEDRGNDSGGD